MGMKQHLRYAILKPRISNKNRSVYWKAERNRYNIVSFAYYVYNFIKELILVNGSYWVMA